MNNDSLSPLAQRLTFLVSLFAGSLFLSACGGDSDDKKSATSSSSSLSSARSSYVAASVPGNGSGTWPSVKVEAQTPKQLALQWSPVDGATYYRLFKHDASVGGVMQVGGDLTTTQATDDIGVHVHDWVNNYYYVEACNSEGCQKSDLTFTATEMVKAIGYVKASNGEAFDNFGWSVALSTDGNTLAVGAPGEDSYAIGANGDQTNNASLNAGAVYLFTKANGVWVQQAYLKASNTEQPNEPLIPLRHNDRFGYEVALSDDGNTLAVSAILEDSPSRGVNCNQQNHHNYNVGAVYVFTRTGESWTQDAYIKPFYSILNLNAPGGLRFGESLALSGDGKTLAIGASSDLLNFSSTLNFHGSSFSSNPTDVPCLDFYPSSAPTTSSSSSTSSSNKSSSSASSTSAVGGRASGAVYVFTKTEDRGWSEESFLKASNAAEHDAFGASIALSRDGNTLAVGAIGEDSGATGVNGDESSNLGYIRATEDSLTISESPSDDSRAVQGQLDSGAVYVFTRADKLWTQQSYLKPATAYWATHFGFSVDLSADGTMLGVGAPGDASAATGINGDMTQSLNRINTGAAYLFNRASGSWVQEAIIKPSSLNSQVKFRTMLNEDIGRLYLLAEGGVTFGSSVRLSEDGSLLVVGAPGEASAANGINGNQGDTSKPDAGAVFVFKRNNNVWSQQSYVKPGNPDRNDRFGMHLDLSGDGKTMAVGAHRESGRGYAPGSSTSSAASSTPAGSLDQSDNSAEAAGAVYVY